MERFERTASFLALSLAVAACSTAQPRPPAEPRASDERFPGASDILTGFDPAEAGADWRAGDRLLFALTSESGTRTHTKLIELELLGACVLPGAEEGASSGNVEFLQLVESMRLSATLGTHELEWSSPLLRVGVRVYEADGRPVQETEAKVPETTLRTGMHPALELSAELEAVASTGIAPSVSDDELRLFGEAGAMLPTLLEILQGDSVLRSLLMQVVGTPSLLTLLGGIDVQLSCDFQEVSLAPDIEPPPCSSGSIYRVPLHIAVDGDPALELELEVAAAEPPVRLSGGIVAVSGVSPRDARRSVRLELLAARRGPPGAEIHP